MKMQKLSQEDWMKEVDKWVYAKVGCSVHDLPDCCFADWYEDGMSSKAAAGKAVKNAKDEY